MIGRLSLDELQRQARLLGYTLVPRPGVANWHPVLMQLIRGRYKIHAIKLWREVTGLDLKSAKDQIEAICSLNTDPPDGTEYPDLPNDPTDLVKPRDARIGRLDYYREPQRYRLTPQDEKDAAAVHAAEVQAAKRRLGNGRLSGEYDRAGASKGNPFHRL